MFYPQAMSEIQLIVPLRDLLSVTRVLSSEGIFQQADSSNLGSQTSVKADNTWREQASAYASLERRVLMLMQTLNIEETPPPAVQFKSMADLDTIRPQVEKIEQEVKAATDRLTEQGKKLEQLQNTLTQIETLAGIQVDIGALRSPRHLFSMLGTIPNDHVERLQTSLSRMPNVFLILREDRRKPWSGWLARRRTRISWIVLRAALT